MRALARSERSAAAVEALGAEPVRGDLADRLRSRPARPAARPPSTSPPTSEPGAGARSSCATTSTGTENTLAGCRAARRAQVRPLRHRGRPDRRRAADRGRRDGAPAPGLEGAVFGDQGARRAGRPPSGAEGFDAVVLRPRFVWGAGDTTLLPGILSMVEPGRFAWIGGGPHLTDTTHVDNVVEGLLAAASRGRGRRGLLRHRRRPGRLPGVRHGADRDPGRRAPDPLRPGRLAGPSAAASETVWRLLRLGGEPPLTRFALWLSSQECTIDISKARAELGYAPIKARAEGLAELARAGYAARALELGGEQLRVQGADQGRERSCAALDDSRRARDRARRSARSAARAHRRSPAPGPSSAGRRRGPRNPSSRSSPLRGTSTPPR